MELTVGICKGEDCGKEALIVNKKYYLCEDCNFKRTHKGKSKQDVYMERRTKKQSEKEFNPFLVCGPGLKKRKTFKTSSAAKLKAIGTRERFRCSDGEMVSQVTIQANKKLVYQIIDQDRDPVCQGSGRCDFPLSHSHTISERRCKEIGKTELVWDEDNIELEGYEPPCSNPIAAHNIWEVGQIERKVMLLNFDRKLEYIKKHDPETFRAYLFRIENSNVDEVIKQKYRNLYGSN